MTYLRTLDDGTPAAGKFEGWPDSLKDFKLLDPCCGSGHFLSGGLPAAGANARMAAEGLTALDAVDYVLQDNLHGLELDARCVEIAVFALALVAATTPMKTATRWACAPTCPRRKLPAAACSSMPAPKTGRR